MGRQRSAHGCSSGLRVTDPRLGGCNPFFNIINLVQARQDPAITRSIFQDPARSSKIPRGPQDPAGARSFLMAQDASKRPQTVRDDSRHGWKSSSKTAKDVPETPEDARLPPPRWGAGRHPAKNEPVGFSRSTRHSSQLQRDTVTRQGG